MFIKVALNKDIINECLQLHYNNQPSGKKLKKRLLWIPLILIALGTGLLIDEFRQPTPGSNTYMALSYIGFAIAYYIYLKYRLMKAGGRMLKALGPNANFTIQIQGDQIITTTPFDNNTLTWIDFTGALISRHNVLLYQSNNTFTMLNHTFFEAGDFEDLKEEVRNKVSPVKEVFS